MSLPYEHATSGKNAIKEIQKILQAFGATSFGYMENYAEGTVMVQFECRNRQVSIKASAKGYAVALMRHRKRSGRGAWTENSALKQGQIAVYSILRDWIKGQLTAVETGMLSFEAAFLGQILLPNGETVLERLATDNILQIEGYP